MTPPAILAVLSRSAGTPQVYRLLNGTTPVAVGPALPGASLENYLGENNVNASNRAIQFKGRIYVSHGSEIWRYDEDADTWSSVYDNANGATGDVHTGIHVYDDEGTPKMIYVHGVGANNNIRAVSSATGDSGSWATVHQSASGWPGKIGRAIMYRNQFWVPWEAGTADVVRIDPVQGTRDNYNLTGEPSEKQGYDFCIFQNELYLLRPVDQQAAALYRYDASLNIFSFVQSLTVDANPSASWHTTTAFALFTDNVAMYALHKANNGSAQAEWYLTKLTPNGATFTETDRRTNLPADWKAAGVRTGSQSQVSVWVDTETDSSDPKIYIYHLTNDTSGGAHSWYEWPGDGINWGSANASVVGSHYICAPKMGGGERFWTSGDLDILVQKAELAGGGTRVTFEVFGDPLRLDHGTIGSTVGGPYEVGETVRDQTTMATAEIVNVVSGTENYIEVGGASGSFGNGNVIEQISGANSGTTATITTQSGGLGTRSIRLLYSVDEETPTSIATLSGGTVIQSANASATAVVATDTEGDIISNITADGITTYSVIWDVTTDGVNAGDQINLMAVIIP